MTTPLIILPKNSTILKEINFPDIEIEQQKLDVNVISAIKSCLSKINPNMLIIDRSTRGTKNYHVNQLKTFINCILQIENLSKYLEKNDTLIADLKNSLKKKENMIYYT